MSFSDVKCPRCRDEEKGFLCTYYYDVDDCDCLCHQLEAQIEQARAEKEQRSNNIAVAIIIGLLVLMAYCGASKSRSGGAYENCTPVYDYGPGGAFVADCIYE